ncbi:MULTISPECIES: hypothetical protein [unclassified Vibrio]|uniref:hypothetical protein n=1 Tax=unclassified Vibrio TaxID=2614977 RepID=UPI00354AE268
MKLPIATLLITSAFNTSAFTIVIKNNTDAPIMPFVMNTDGLTADSINGWITANNERVYDKRSSWLDDPSVNVNEGSTHEMLMGDDHVTGFTCGDILFEGSQEILVTQDSESNDLICQVQPLGTVTESSSYTHNTDGKNRGFIIKDMKNESDIDRPEKYADGPQDLVWGGAGIGVNTYVTVNAINNQTGSEHPVIITMRRSNQCTWREMNTTVSCQSATISSFNAFFEESLNDVLPSGAYSGVTKIGVAEWQGSEVDNFNLGIEITKE